MRVKEKGQGLEGLAAFGHIALGYQRSEPQDKGSLAWQNTIKIPPSGERGELAEYCNRATSNSLIQIRYFLSLQTCSGSIHAINAFTEHLSQDIWAFLRNLRSISRLLRDIE